MWGIAVEKSRKKGNKFKKEKNKGYNHLKLFQSSASKVHSKKIRSNTGCVCARLSVCVYGAIAWKGLVLWQEGVVSTRQYHFVFRYKFYRT